MLYFVAAACGFSATGALVKLLGNEGIGAFQSSLARALLGLVFLLPVMCRQGLKPQFRTDHKGLHLVRALAGGGAMIMGFWAYTLLPLAEATAITFTIPLFTTILAYLVLKESVGWRRWAATVMGFVGILIMLRPGSGALDLAALPALFMAIGLAVAITIVKLLPKGESENAMLFYFLVATGLMTTPFALAGWTWPSVMEWILLSGVGLLGLVSQAAIIRAYRTGEASFLAPFDYLRLLLAIIFGALLFEDWPDLWTYAGATVIIMTTLYIAHRENRLRRSHRSKI